MTEIVIYSKPGCHLCDEAKDVLRQVGERVPFRLTEVNIEDDPVLFERYRYDIPVLFVGGRKAFKHRVTAEQLLRRLRQEQEPSS